MKTLDQLIDEQRERASRRKHGHLWPAPPKRERKRPKLAPEQSREYRLAKRARWLLAGIVQPKDDAERAWLAAERAWLNERAA